MEQANQLFGAPDPAQEYVSSEELVCALTSIESQEVGETADRLKIGETIRQLGLDVTPEQLLAEVKAERERRRLAAREAARRKRGLRIVASIIGAILLITILINFLDAQTATAPPAPVQGTTRFGSDFDSMMRQFRSNSFDDGKVAFVRVMAKGHAFTTEEVHQIMSEMSFDPARVEAAVILYPHLTDQQNAYKLLDTMSFDQGRKDLIARLGLDKQ